MKLRAFAELSQNESLFAGSLGEAVDALITRARSGPGGYFCLCNVHLLVTADSRPEVAGALKGASLVFPDGAPVAWLVRRTTGATQRVAGVDLMTSAIDRGRAAGIRHVLFGSTEATVGALQEQLIRDYPGAEIVGIAAPPAESLVHGGTSWADWIRSQKAHIVWVGLGAPKQELWMAANEPLIDASCVGVGAAFDFLVGAKRRAPLWMQRAGLEWFHRLASEPRRLGWRYVSTNSRFVCALVLSPRLLTKIGARRA